MFRQAGALLEGHFILRSGRRSRQFFQCAILCEDMQRVSQMAEKLLARIPPKSFETVVAPAMGGLVIGQEVARQAGVRYLFLEKVDGDLALRRGFKIRPGEKVLVVEDVVTRGGRVKEAIEILKNLKAEVTGIGVIADRSEEPIDFGSPLYSLVSMNVETFDPDDLPEDLQTIPAIKPGS